VPAGELPAVVAALDRRLAGARDLVAA